VGHFSSREHAGRARDAAEAWRAEKGLLGVTWDTAKVGHGLLKGLLGITRDSAKVCWGGVYTDARADF